MPTPEGHEKNLKRKKRLLRIKKGLMRNLSNQRNNLGFRLATMEDSTTELHPVKPVRDDTSGGMTSLQVSKMAQ